MPTDTPGNDASAQVLVSLSSFGAAEVRRHGQLWFTQLSFAAGADGVEVRSELLVDAAAELPAIARAVHQAGKRVVYSCAEPLWSGDGELATGTLQTALEMAAQLGARRLKMSIGGFGAASHPSLAALGQLLAGHTHQVELLIENDQSPAAGTLAALQDFFAASHAHGLSPGMTFDMGNWHWTGECPLQAAAALASRVRYVHCKGVQRQPSRWVAVPLRDSAAPWRAVLRALPATVPWAIEYPLAGDDLLALTAREVQHLRSITAGLAARNAA